MKFFSASFLALLVAPSLAALQEKNRKNAAARSLRVPATSAATGCCSGDLRSSFSGAEVLKFQRPGLPERTYRVYTPSGYNSATASSKLVLSFHGWCGDGSSWSQDASIQRLADQHNYIVVAPDGLGSNEGSCNSWSFPGSTTGLGRNGLETTCNTSLSEPNNCYNSCNDICQNRCSWTQCQDDDVAFVRDLVQGRAGFTNTLKDVVCFDPNKVYVMGASNGGMMTWNLIQDNRTASLFVAAAPMIGLPHCDYDIAGTVPVISLTSRDDETVSPSNLPHPGNPADVCIENRDGEGYRFVSSHRITSSFAQANGCLDAQNSNTAFPSQSYNAGSDQLDCKTWCPGSAPFAVDCAFSAGHWTPDYVYEAAFGFFGAHSD